MIKANQACHSINYAEWGVWNAVPRGEIGGDLLRMDDEQAGRTAVYL